MEILQSIIDFDKDVLLFLHSKSSSSFDFFWIIITNPLYWTPLAIFVLYAGFNVFKLKKTLVLFLTISLTSTLSLLIVNLIKNYVQRLRPLNDPNINDSIRTIITANDFSFVSGHSAVSFTIAFLSYWFLKNHYRYAYLIFLFPLLFAYSRIYLALHYPLDIIAGGVLGYCIALISYKTTNTYFNSLTRLNTANS